MSVRSQKTKDDFIKYLEEHPNERFWQAVRNFSGYGFVLVTNEFKFVAGKGEFIDPMDTFYWEELKEEDN